MIGITFTLKDGHMVEVCEGNSTCCPWGLDYARELGVPLSAKVGIDTWALIDDEEVYTINHMWHQKTCSDMRLDEWLEENADTYAGKLSKIKADIDRVKEEEEFVKTMTKNEKAAFFAGKRGARLEERKGIADRRPDCCMPMNCKTSSNWRCRSKISSKFCNYLNFAYICGRNIKMLNNESETI